MTDETHGLGEGFTPDEYLNVWSDSPRRAAEFFGYVLGVTADVEVEDRSDRNGRVLYRVFPREG